MNIPSKSTILINGVNIYSLILGSILAQNGIDVLLIDAKDSFEDDLHFENVNNYNIDFLKNINFELVENCISANSIFKTSKSILANNLCSILWNTNTSIEKKANDFTKVYLKQHQKLIAHQTTYILNKNELIISTDCNLNILNIATLFWKLKGVLNQQYNYKLLINHKAEELIIKSYKINKTNFLNKLLNKPSPHISLKESKINLHLSQTRTIEAGDLLPNLTVFDEKRKINTCFYDWCKFGNCSIIMLGELSQYNLLNYALWIKKNFSVSLFYLPPTEKNQYIFEYFKIIDGEKKTLIIRPDRFIGMINDKIDLEIIENYLLNFIEFKPKKQLENNFLELNQQNLDN